MFTTEPEYYQQFEDLILRESLPRLECPSSPLNRIISWPWEHFLQTFECNVAERGRSLIHSLAMEPDMTGHNGELMLAHKQ
jgi:hypothetical protein